MSGKILFISRDPGGTNQLAALRDIMLGKDSDTKFAVYEYLHISLEPDIILIAKDYAKAIWQQNGIACEGWPGIASEAEIADYLAGLDPDQIITSTCHLDDRTEQTVWRVARKLGIKTTAFLDSGLNIALRFTDGAGQIILPDQVSMINDQATSTLLSLGLNAQNMVILGDLYQGYAKVMAKGTMTDKLRQDWGVKADESLILFASDYISEMQAMGAVFETTEFECLNCLLDLLKSGDISKYIKDISGPYRLVIRPHPKDVPGKYDNYLLKSTDNITILINDMAPSLEAVLSSNIVAGYGSSLMNEARVLGVAVLELGPIVKNRRGHKKTAS